MTITTEYGNFGNPQDLNHFMSDESLESIKVSCDYWGAKIAENLTLTKQEVQDWADGKDMITQQPIEDVADIRKKRGAIT